jgi:surfeit locus 1 family protein
MQETQSSRTIELPETTWEVARRPRWIAALVFALAVAALFAWLGHWQLDRSIESLKPVSYPTETRKVLSEVSPPQTEFLDKWTGQKVSVSGHFVAGDFTVISDRIQQGKSKNGYWLLGRFVDSTNQASVVVALGWGATHADAARAIPSIPVSPTVEDIAGRYLPTEAADDGKFTEGYQTVASVPQIINQWSNFSGDVYNGYIVEDRGWGGLTAIYSPPPIDQATLNWLNVFYAVEWAVFAGFAIFLWFRLVRDAFEREIEEAEEAAALLSTPPPTPTRIE